MSVGNLGGGNTTSATTSWVGYRGCADTFTVPTGGNTDKAGNKPVLITSVRAYVAGRSNSAEVRFEMGSATTSYFTAGTDTSAQLTSYKTINAYFSNGGTQTFRIKNSATDDYFYYGKGGSGYIYAINSSNEDVLSLTTTDGLVGEFNYFYVPTAPGTPTVTQPDVSLAELSVSWSAPSSNGGSTITGYRVEYSLSSTFASGVTSLNVTGTTTTITGLLSGSKYYVRVAAKNAVTDAGNTWSAYSATSNYTVMTESFDYDGWTLYGTFTNATRALRRLGMTALPEEGLALTIETTGTGTGGVTTGTSGIQRTVTGLTIGAQYKIDCSTILKNTSSIGNVYALGVSGIGYATANTITSALVPISLNTYTFTATSTSHVVRIQLQETLTYSSGTVVENVAFYDFQVARVGVTSPYLLQDNVLESSLANHFDLATRSVGAHWWVDRTNVTQFMLDFSTTSPICTFSDVKATGNLNYNDIKIGLQTRGTVNEILMNNIGKRLDPYTPKTYTDFSYSVTAYDGTLQDTWGPRKTELTTNIYTETVSRNLVTNPNAQYGGANDTYHPGSSGSTSQIKISKLSKLATGATGYLPTTAVAAAPGIGDNVVTLRMTSNTATGFHIVVAGATETDGFEVEQGGTYIVTGYVRAGIGNTGGLSAKWGNTYYSAKGTAIGGNNYQTPTVTPLNSAWTRMSWTFTVPSGTGITNVRLLCRWDFTGTDNTGYAYFLSGVTLENASTSPEFFSGDTPDSDTYLYEWEGTPGDSVSRKMLNPLDERAAEIIAAYGTPEVKVSEIVWNAQDDISKAHLLDINSVIAIEFDGTTDNYRIVGMSHDITPTRWLITMKVEKV